MTNVIIDGDACPVVDSVIELTQGTGISVLIMRSFSHFSTKLDPPHVQTIYVDDGPDAVDYKIVQRARTKDIVITQDYGLASLLLNRVDVVMHHKGEIYTPQTIDTLLEQRHASAQFRKSGGRTKGPSPFTKEDRAIFEQKFSTIIQTLTASEED